MSLWVIIAIYADQGKTFQKAIAVLDAKGRSSRPAPRLPIKTNTHTHTHSKDTALINEKKLEVRIQGDRAVPSPSFYALGAHGGWAAYLTPRATLPDAFLPETVSSQFSLHQVAD